MNRVILSGATGFIGCAVAKLLTLQGVKVVGIVKDKTSDKEQISKLEKLGIEIIECELAQIKNLQYLIKERGFDVFYQFAWDGLDVNSLLCYSKQLDNITWMMDSIFVASELGCKKFIGAGSITQTELYTANGRNNIRDRHKFFRVAQLACETVGRCYSKELGIEFVWPIIINIYGEGDRNPRLINSLLKSIIQNNPFTLSSGEQLYDFLHIDDAARAFMLLGEFGREEREYIISSGSPKKLREYLTELRDTILPTYRLDFSHEKFKGCEIGEEYFYNKNLLEDTGFKPNISFEEGIKRTFEWIRNEMNEKDR